MPAGIMAFVFEMNSNAVLVSRPKVFAQPVVQLPGPLALQKCDDLRAALSAPSIFVILTCGIAIAAQ